MTTQIVPIHRADTNSNSTNNKTDIWFDAFHFSPGQDQNIRWISLPCQQSFQEKHPHDLEKFRITFDVENFQPEHIKICIQNRKLTISGIYEEHSQNRFVQKQFERTFDIPANADVDSMASFITEAHMLVVEIPLNPSTQTDHANMNNNKNDRRRLSFSLDKFNASNDSSNLSTPGQQIRQITVTKTTTTNGSAVPSAETAELLKNINEMNESSVHTHSTRTTEHDSSNTDNQNIAVRELNASPSSSSTVTKTSEHTRLTSSNLSDLPSEIPPELLANGGTITIQKRKISVTKGTDGNTDRSATVPLTHNNDTKQTTSSITNTVGSTSSNALNQQQSNISDNRCSKTISNTNQSRRYTLEEFLQNKTWNPSLIDGPNGKKILYMRLQMKPGTTMDQIKISLNGYELRVEFNNKASTEGRRFMMEYSYRQVTLFPTCEVDQLKTEFKDDGFLHIQVPINM